MNCVQLHMRVFYYFGMVSRIFSVSPLLTSYGTISKSIAQSTQGYITCQSSYEDNWGNRQDYYCFDKQQCCSSVKEWYGCCDKSGTTTVLDKPVSIKLVLIIAGVISLVLLILLFCCLQCRKRKRNTLRTMAQRVEATTEFDKGPTAPPVDELPPPYEQVVNEQAGPLRIIPATNWQ